MANQFETNERTELVALRAAESAGYLTIGSKKYLKDQLTGKRNGTKYGFVIRDAGEFQSGIDLSATGPSDLKERKVYKEIEVGNVLIGTNILEKVTDLNWDKEVAIPQGKKLINGVVKKTVDADLGWQNTAFVGGGFQPLSKAQSFLHSISDDDVYGFVDPMINGVLTSNGQSFDPPAADTEPMARKGLLGKIADVEYRGNQFMPMVSVSSTLVTEMAKCSAITYAEVDETSATLTFTGVGAIIPKGYVVWVDGVYACDLVGDRTSALKAFVAYEDGTSNGVMKIRPINFVGEGTKEVCDITGAALGASKSAAITAFNNLTSIDYLKAGNYFGGFVRVDGAMEFETLDELDASNAETKMSENEGLYVFENRAIDVIKGTNVTRWIVSSVAGIVDPRAVAFVLVSDKVVNPVTLQQ